MAKASRRSLWTQKIQGKLPQSAEKTAYNNPPTQAGYKGIILGIDPSLRGTGLAIIDTSLTAQFKLLHSLKITLKASLSFHQCLASIFTTIHHIIKQYPIEHVALEQTIYVQNFQTAQILGAARGAAIAAAATENKPICEYPPLRIKQAVSGHGRASKEQIHGMVTNLLNLKNNKISLDESDAAAVALCHAFTYR